MVEEIVKGRVSVSLVTWNSWPIVEECITSLFRQNHQPLEVLLVDNASCDGTPGQVRFNYPQVTVFENARNEGFARGHNQNIRRSCGEYILILNPDVLLAPDFLKILVDKAREKGEGGAFSGLLMRMDENKVDSAGIGFSKWKRVFDDRRIGTTQEAPIFGPSGAAALYRRFMLEDIREGDEYFDEAFFAYYEDVDLAWRAQKLGWSAWLIPEAKAWHARKASQREYNRVAQCFVFRNRYLTLLKNERLSDYLLHMPVTIIYDILRFYALLFTNPSIIFEFSSIFRLVPNMLLKRKKLQLRHVVNRFTPNHYPLDSRS